MKTLIFKSDPEFADLWDACLHNLLYNKDAYVTDVLDLFKSIGINKKSKILDTCAGTGFISLYLRQNGFEVDCMDLMPDEIRVFKRKAELLKTNNEIQQLSWKQIPENYLNESYNFLFCRGNSFIYAGGGWNENPELNSRYSLKAYRETLKIFYDTLKTGGYLYIDKFPDNEQSHYDAVAKFQFGDKIEDLIFYTKIFPKEQCRKATMIRKNSEGKEIAVPNKCYNLTEGELERMLNEAGFKFKRISLDSEKNFVTWLAQK